MKVYLIIGLATAVLYMVAHRAHAAHSYGHYCTTTCTTDSAGRTHCVTTCV